MGNAEPVDRRAILDELERARATFHQLLADATEDDLSRRSQGTRWTNEQLLFHLLFGYVVVRALLVLMNLLGRLPDAVSRAFARILNSATAPYNVVNYLGSCAGALVFNHRRVGAQFDRTIDALERRLARETEANLARGMHYPVRWDPFFTDYMTLEDVYRFPTRHFDFHAMQLTLGDPD